MGSGQKKEYLQLGEHSVLGATIRAFVDSGVCDGYVITHPPGRDRETLEALGSVEISGAVILVPGGPTRQLSVLAGLEALAESPPESVLIHDGSRPWVSQELIRRVHEATLKYAACLPVVPSTDALKITDEEGFVLDHPSRSAYMAAQTPQGFAYRLILQAHRKAKTDGRVYVDDTEVFDAYEGRVFTVPGDPANRKITYQHDVPMTTDGMNRSD